MGKPTKQASIPLLDVPPSFFSVLEEVARERLAGDDESGEALAREVARLSALYTRERDEIGREDRTGLLAARLRFFLPRDLPKIIPPLVELATAGALPTERTWSVLDLGAGLGATSFGVARFARVTGSAEKLEVVAVDPFERGLTILRALAARAERAELCPVSVKTVASDMATRLPEGSFDLILFGLSLNEWARRRSPEDAADLLCRAGKKLAAGGSLIVIEPAQKKEARFLQETRDAIAARGDGLTIFAPCLSSAPCPMLARPRDWCHAEHLGELPPTLSALARAAGLRRSRRTFAYLTLRRDGQSIGDATGPNTYRVVSQGLPSKGKHEIFVCGGGALVRLTRLNRHRGEPNEAFTRAARGDLITLSPDVEVVDGKGRIEKGDAVVLEGGRPATGPPERHHASAKPAK